MGEMQRFRLQLRCDLRERRFRIRSRFSNFLLLRPSVNGDEPSTGIFNLEVGLSILNEPYELAMLQAVFVPGIARQPLNFLLARGP